MKRLLGPNKRRRLSGMAANFAQLTFGAALVSYFFKEGGWAVRVAALIFFIATFMIAVLAEPENGKG